MDISTQQEIGKTVEALRRGETILYPTDTIWGLGCDARDEEAVRRVFELKHRPSAKAMLLLAADLEMVSRFVGTIPEAARRILAEATRPTTIIYDGARGIAPELIADDGSVGFRIPDDEFCLEVCRRLGAPVVSTSANISGLQPPLTFSMIDPAVRDAADYACTIRRDVKKPALPSNIYKVTTDGRVTVIREFKDTLPE